MLMQGDRLQTTCYYNTQTEASVVKGGFSSSEEMCLDFIEVVPAPKLYLCQEILGVKFVCGTASGTSLTTNLLSVVATSDKGKFTALNTTQYQCGLASAFSSIGQGTTSFGQRVGVGILLVLTVIMI